MIVRLRAHAGALLVVAAAALALPASVLAASGGAAPLGAGSTSPAPSGAGSTSPAPSGAGSTSPAPTGAGDRASAPAVVTQPGETPISATGDGITVETLASGVLRQPLHFTGNVGSAAAGQVVEIDRRGRQTRGLWSPTTHGLAAADGSFSATWPVNHIGQFQIRAVVESGASARAASVSPDLTITVYRPSVATQYGPGFYGKHTACGQILGRSTLGVANRRLPCGTPVAILYGGRTLVVPVIDRGPYARGVDWDLTQATARALSILGTATIGAVSLPAAG